MPARWLIGVFFLLATAAGNVPPEFPAVVSAGFVQTRHIKELDLDVVIRGRMISEKNGRLRWQVDSPARSVTVITAEKLTHFNADTGKIARLDTARMPWLRELRASFVSWLCGDRAEMGKRFEVAEPTPGTLILLPRTPELARMYRRIELNFDFKVGAWTRIFITETSGDTLEIRFLEVKTNPAVPESVWSLPAA